MPTEYNTQELKAKAGRHLWMSYQPPEPYAAEGGPPVLVQPPRRQADCRRTAWDLFKQR